MLKHNIAHVMQWTSVLMVTISDTSNVMIPHNLCGYICFVYPCRQLGAQKCSPFFFTLPFKYTATDYIISMDKKCGTQRILIMASC
jgi:hypothetical protein